MKIILFVKYNELRFTGMHQYYIRIFNNYLIKNDKMVMSKEVNISINTIYWNC
jgi:hypothetical protein